MGWRAEFDAFQAEHPPDARERFEPIVAKTCANRIEFYGVDKPIPPDLVRELEQTIFPLVVDSGRTPMLAGVIASEKLAALEDGFAAHCKAYHIVG